MTSHFQAALSVLTKPLSVRVAGPGAARTSARHCRIQGAVDDFTARPCASLSPPAGSFLLQLSQEGACGWLFQIPFPPG